MLITFVTTGDTFNIMYKIFMKEAACIFINVVPRPRSGRIVNVIDSNGPRSRIVVPRLV